MSLARGGPFGQGSGWMCLRPTPRNPDVPCLAQNTHRHYRCHKCTGLQHPHTSFYHSHQNLIAQTRPSSIRRFAPTPFPQLLGYSFGNAQTWGRPDPNPNPMSTHRIWRCHACLNWNPNDFLQCPRCYNARTQPSAPPLDLSVINPNDSGDVWAWHCPNCNVWNNSGQNICTNAGCRSDPRRDS